MNDETTAPNGSTENQPASCRCPLRNADSIIENIFDRILGSVRRLLSPPRIELCSGMVEKTGYLAALVSVVLLLITAIRLSCRGGSWYQLRTMVMCAVLIPFLLYLTVKFIRMSKELLTANPTRIGSQAFLDSLAMICLSVGGVWLVSDIILGCKGAINQLLSGIVVFMVMYFLGFLALNPKALNITVDENVGAGETALSILSFFFKAILKAAPLLFGVFSTLGAIVLILTMVNLGKNEDIMALGNGTQAGTLVVAAALLPAVCALAFMLLYLLIDVINAILANRKNP